MTVLITTHDLAEADRLADRIAILFDGRIIAEGTSAELTRQIAGHDRVRWLQDGHRFERATPDATRFVRELFDAHGYEITELQITRAKLEDTYLMLLHAAEQHHDPRR